MAKVHRLTRKKIGEILLQAGVIDDLQLQAALTEQGRTHEPLGEILVRRDFVTETEIAHALVCQFSLPFLSASQVEVSPTVANLLPPDLMREHLVAPLDRFGNCLTLLTAGAIDPDVLTQVEQQTGCEVQLFVGTAADLKEFISRIEALRTRAAPAPHDLAAEGAAAPRDHAALRGSPARP